LVPFLAGHVENRASASMLLTEVEDTRRYGRVDFSQDGLITKFEEKGATTGKGWINAGVYLISREIIERLPKGRNISLEKDVFVKLVGQSYFVHCGRMSKFIDIGIPESIAQAQLLMQKETSLKEIP